MALITCKNLTLGYEGVTVTEGIDFEVNSGDYLCIIGANGAGKSTLMKALLHLIEPMSGEIVYGDGMSRNDFGYLPQQTRVQKDFPASVWEIVLSGTVSKKGFRPFYSKSDKTCAEENMKRMSVWELKNESFRDLSGGQQQRVLLARALCASGKVLLMDEPITGLDPKVTLDFYNLISDLNKSGLTVIMVSHDVHSAIHYASHILHVGPTQLYFGCTDCYLKSDVWHNFGGRESGIDCEECRHKIEDVNSPLYRDTCDHGHGHIHQKKSAPNGEPKMGNTIQPAREHEPDKGEKKVYTGLVADRADNTAKEENDR